MSDWLQKTIKQTSYLKGRIGWQGLRASEFIEDGPYLITGTDFTSGKIEWDNCYHVTEIRFNEAPYIHVKDGDLLITKDGTIGKIAYVENCPDKAVLNSGIFLLRSKNNYYQHKFVYHILNSHIFDSFLVKNLNGSTISHLYQNVFERFPLPLPKHEIQKQITRIIDCIDTNIEKTEALIHKYQQIKAGLMHDLFTRGVTEDGKLRPPREQAPDLYKETPIGWIPKEWGTVKASNICYPITKGTTPSYFINNFSKIKSIPYIRVENLSFDGSLHFASDSLFVDIKIHNSELARSKVFVGDILMNIVGPPLGKVSLVSDMFEEWNTNQAVAIYRVLQKKYRRYLLYYLLSDFSQQWLTIRSKQTSGQVNLTLELCSNLDIPLPSNDAELNKISDALFHIFETINIEKAMQIKLLQKKSGLMHDLLTGKVQVIVNEKEAAHE